MSVKRHTFYNLAGSIAPMIISMVTVPAYLHKIGDARYGVLALVWLFLGYFGLFDPGITRAASFHIARLHGKEHDAERESVFWTALVVNFAFGMIGAVVLYVAARPLFMSTFKMPPEMRDEVLASLPWLAASIPVSIMTGVLSGALQAREWFGFFNVNSVANNVLSQLVPLTVAYLHGPDLKWLIPAVLITRTIGAIPACLGLIRAMPLFAGGSFDRAYVKPLFTYGGWITVSNLLNPILGTMDRMLIGSVLSAQAVAFYTVPFNLVSRVSVIPGAVASSLFPKLSRGKLEDSAKLASDAVITLAAVMTPLIVLGIAALRIFMHYWVGASFADQAAPVGIVLLLGVWANGLAFIPNGHLQAINRPDTVAKFHAYEIVPFLAILWVGLHYFGLIGAAWAWTARVVVDSALLFVIAGQIPGWRRILPAGALLIIAACFSPHTFLSYKVGIEIVVLAASIWWAWSVSPALRSVLRPLLTGRVLDRIPS